MSTSTPAAAVEEAPRPLIQSKLEAPVPRRRVSRRELLERCAGPPRKLTLIRAPAGWGKSTLLADWYALESETRPFAWVALDAGDNDPVRFWTYVIHAIRILDPGAGEASLPMLGPRASASSTTSCRRSATSLRRYRIRSSSSSTTTTWSRTRRSTRACLPAGAPSPDPRARAREPIRAVTPARPAPRPRRAGRDRRTTPPLLRRGGRLTSSTTCTGSSSTAGTSSGCASSRRDGRPGLYLATLTIRGRAERARVHRGVRGRQPPRRRLPELGGAGRPRRGDTRASSSRRPCSQRLSAPLCDAVTDRPGSAQMLHELERSNFFLVPLDTKREWYCYHQLFGELLRQELASSSRSTSTPCIAGRAHGTESTATHPRRFATRRRQATSPTPPS